MEVWFTVPGEPVAKGRPRLGKYGSTYTPAKTVEYENLVKLAYMGNPLIQGYIMADIDLYFQIPKSVSKVKRGKMERAEIRPTKRPDCDNCIKAILDALNGIAYHDDSQVVEVRCRKLYSEQPRAVVMLKSIGGDSDGEPM